MDNMQLLPKISLTVDILIFTIDHKELKLVLIKRKYPPFVDSWALPGGFILENESPETAARRELAEETGINNVYLEQLYTFGEPKRDPRGHVVSIAYTALVPKDKFNLIAATDAKDVSTFNIKKLPTLAFDHAAIIQYGLERLKNKLGYSNIAVNLLPTQFRLTELQDLYETILDKTLDKRNFRKKMLSLNLLQKLDKKVLIGSHRPASLYQFKTKKPINFD